MTVTRRVGVKKSEHFVDVIYGSPLKGYTIDVTALFDITASTFQVV